MQMTDIREARDGLAQQALASMSPAERTRLQAQAAERGITAEQLVVEIVTTTLAEGR